MALDFDETFELNAPVELVWTYLIDPYRVVGCLPGATLTDKIDARTYAGTISVKVGLVSASFAGTVTFERVDPVGRVTEIVGVGQDGRGKNSATMRMVSRLTEGGSRTLVSVRSSLELTGLLAQMGRGIIQNVARDMLRQFAGRFTLALDRARAKYADVVKAHAQSFAKLYPAKLAELEALSGVRVAGDGTNNAASAADVVKYIEAVKEIGGDVAHTSARLTTRAAAQQHDVPLPGI
jgi:carbon monoxide dehydrogenase subunit G